MIPGAWLWRATGSSPGSSPGLLPVGTVDLFARDTATFRAQSKCSYWLNTERRKKATNDCVVCSCHEVGLGSCGLGDCVQSLFRPRINPDESPEEGLACWLAKKLGKLFVSICLGKVGLAVTFYFTVINKCSGLIILPPLVTIYFFSIYLNLFHLPVGFFYCLLNKIHIILLIGRYSNETGGYTGALAWYISLKCSLTPLYLNSHNMD